MRLWMIGCGNMAGAMLHRWIESGTVAADAVDVVNRHDRELPAGVRQGRELPDAPQPDFVILGVKPQQLDAVAERHAGRVTGAPCLISMLAGAEEAALAARFPGPVIVRTMPNLPVALGKGVVPLISAGADPAMRAAISRLMAPLGLVEWFDDAARYDAFGALAGTGPAFLFRFIDALAAAGRSCGLTVQEAARAALATVEGAALMAAASDEPPASLADRVASPGGMTREGLNVLDHDRALDQLMNETLSAALRRGGEMAVATRG